MTQLARPQGLISYRAQNKKARLVRPRTVIYGVILLALVLGFVVSVSTRDNSALDVIRDRQPLYLEAAGGRIENVYSLKLMNKTEAAVSYNLAATGLAGLQLITSQNPIVVPPGELMSVPVRLSAPADALKPGINEVVFSAAPGDGIATITEPSTFFAPVH